jgi:hypothetical protein
MDTYFIKLLIYENVEVINELQLDSEKLKKRGAAMLKHLRYHLSWIIEVIENSYHEKNRFFAKNNGFVKKAYIPLWN